MSNAKFYYYLQYILLAVVGANRMLLIFISHGALTHFVGDYKSSEIISLRQIRSNDLSFYGFFLCFAFSCS